MKMQLWHGLIRSAVRNQPVTAPLQSEFRHQALGRGKQVEHEIRVRGSQRRQIGHGPLGHQQDVHGVAGSWVVKGQQRSGLAQAPDGDGEAHMGKDLADDGPRHP